MIDTLQRHLAALSEARRLVHMVLVNNPSFVALAHPGAAPGERAAAEAALANDRYHAAYGRLNEAIALLTPEPEVATDAEPTTRRLADKIVALKPHLPAAAVRPPALIAPAAAPLPRAQTATPAEPPPSRTASLEERVRYVLDAPAGDGAGANPWPPGRDEAKVAIVFRDGPAVNDPRLASLASETRINRYRLFAP